MRAHGFVDARVHIFAATARLSLTLRKPQYSFYSRLSGPQEHSGHGGVKKNLYPSTTRAVQPVVKRLVA